MGRLRLRPHLNIKPLKALQKQENIYLKLYEGGGGRGQPFEQSGRKSKPLKITTNVHLTQSCLLSFGSVFFFFLVRNRGQTWLRLGFRFPRQWEDKGAQSTTKSRSKLMSNGCRREKGVEGRGQRVAGEKRRQDDPLRRQSIKINELQFIFLNLFGGADSDCAPSSESASQSNRLIVNCKKSVGQSRRQGGEGCKTRTTLLNEHQISLLLATQFSIQIYYLGA